MSQPLVTRPVRIAPGVKDKVRRYEESLPARYADPDGIMHTAGTDHCPGCAEHVSTP